MNNMDVSFEHAQLAQASYALNLVARMSGQGDTAYIAELRSGKVPLCQHSCPVH